MKGNKTSRYINDQSETQSIATQSRAGSPQKSLMGTMFNGGISQGAPSMRGGGLIGNIGAMMGTADKKMGLSMMNPSMRQMSQNKSIMGSKSIRSGGTRRSGSRSRTSKVNENYEDMNIDELDVLIEEGEGEMQRARQEIAKIRRNKTIPAKQKQDKMEPFEEELKKLRYRVAYFVTLKDSKIPFYEKLPKQNEFYKHYMEQMRHKRVIEAAQVKASDDKAMFENASSKINHERA